MRFYLLGCEQKSIKGVLTFALFTAMSSKIMNARLKMGSDLNQLHLNTTNLANPFSVMHNCSNRIFACNTIS